MDGKTLVLVQLINIILLTLLFNGSYCYPWPQQNVYMTRWDKVDLDRILENKRLLHYYYNCLMKKGPCPPDGKELRRALPEALQTACAKCSKTQMEGGIKVIKYLREYEPKKFQILANKYDPEGTYRRRYLQVNYESNST
ncbi:hypothetical protein PV327_003636 [Microctonus hyperodae]|uniref:Chemosensory protein n=1 Tax=Microctonus hyperodae TaxID=165561 RepID=A0AA39L185_MICHY|nr:hypothetical protein PV327_003636 [Microctonus hyperodae]